MTAVASVGERFEVGRACRGTAPRSSHAEWAAPPGRRDPVDLLEEQERTRVDFLVPIRHARMRVSPFTFYRGAARIMAADLADTPRTGLDVQLGGDAHLSNFGAYASPERQLVFDANDFDETLRGPWEWDLKRLAASVMIAGQHLGNSAEECRRATSEVTRAYREAMARFAEQGFMEVWNDYVRVEDVEAASAATSAEIEERLARFTRRATRRTNLQALQKLAERVDGTYRLRSDHPVLIPLRDFPLDRDADAVHAIAMESLQAYRESLSDNRRWLLDRYTPIDIGLKVVGVGSVGMLNLLVLLRGRDDGDPLFLQAKEAEASVLEEFLEPSPYDNHGRRVVEGQRIIQAQSDIFLGWTRSRGPQERDYYMRQLRDWKGSVDIDTATPDQLAFYAGLCGQTLARGHARSGDPVSISAYCGPGTNLDRAVTAFAEAYARQNLEDYQRFVDAIDSGRMAVADSPF